MNRRTFLETAGVVAASMSAFGMSRRPGVKPNVVLILVDDLGYGDLGCYGAPDMRTPHVDALMDAGMRFDSFYANCPVCSPTRASVMTGRYPDLVGVPGVIRTHWENSWGYLSPDAVMLPTVLGGAGYDTACIGKWHLGLDGPSTPPERGFDYFHGYLGDMMDDYYNHRRHGINYMRLGPNEIDPEGHATDLFTEWSVDYIRNRAGSEKPFFLYLAYNAPHTPIQPPDDWLDRIRKRERGMDEKRAKLVALIEHLDDGIGKVMAAVREAGEAENTLVIFVSDNGGQSNVGARNEPLRGGKQDMFEGGIKVPMCAVWPGTIPSGSRSNRVALTMDLYPTVCEAGGAEFGHEIEGRSVLDTLRGKKQSEEDRILFWVRREGGPREARAYYAARKDDWKILQNSPFEPPQLYNLKDDPHEDTPLSNKHPMYTTLSKRPSSTNRSVRSTKPISSTGPFEKYERLLPISTKSGSSVSASNDACKRLCNELYSTT